MARRADAAKTGVKRQKTARQARDEELRAKAKKKLRALLSFDSRAVKKKLGAAATARSVNSKRAQMQLFSMANSAVIGVDEVGRGCLAGPVVACAVMLPQLDTQSELYDKLCRLDDSKKLSADLRVQLAQTVSSCAWYSIGECSPEEIDEINIFHASLLAMKRAVDGLFASIPAKRETTLLLVDGNRELAIEGIEQLPVVGGDGRSAAIAAASVVAKVHRDALMLSLSGQFPQYGWESNKGYPSVSHRKALREHGLTEWHRRSFNCLPEEAPS